VAVETLFGSFDIIMVLDNGCVMSWRRMEVLIKVVELEKVGDVNYLG
jgi:hypothetical protein